MSESSRIEPKQKIDFFFSLFKKTREFLWNELVAERAQLLPESGDPTEEDLNEFMFLMIVLWYLQKKGFFSNNNNYYISNFPQSGDSTQNSSENFSYGRFLSDKIDKFLNGPFGRFLFEPRVKQKEHKKQRKKFAWVALLSNRCFHRNIDLKFTKSPSGLKQVLNRIPADLSLLNMLQFQEQYAGSIDEFTVGAVFEKLLTQPIKKATGAYYTPLEVCNFICELVIRPKMDYILDHGSAKSAEADSSAGLSFLQEFQIKLAHLLKQIPANERGNALKTVFSRVVSLRIMDPAIGSGHFLASMVNLFTDLFCIIWDNAVRLQCSDSIFNLELIRDDGAIEKVDFSTFASFENVAFNFKRYYIFPLIYGVDINPRAVIVTKFRLLLNLFETWSGKNMVSTNKTDRIPLRWNLKTGNSLLGYLTWEQVESQFINNLKKTVVPLSSVPTSIFQHIQKLVEEIDLKSPFTSQIVLTISERGYPAKTKSSV